MRIALAILAGKSIFNLLVHPALVDVAGHYAPNGMELLCVRLNPVRWREYVRSISSAWIFTVSVDWLTLDHWLNFTYP